MAERDERNQAIRDALATPVTMGDHPPTMDELRRVLLDAERESGPCPCGACVAARERLRSLAWPSQNASSPVPRSEPGAGDA